MREPANETGAEREVGSQPAVQPPKGQRRRREDRVEQGCREREPEKWRYGRLSECVSKHRIHRNRAELQPEDRRRHDAAGSGHGEHCGKTAWQRVALQSALDPRNADENRRDSRERQLEARLQESVRRGRHQHRSTDEQCIPPVGRPRREPCQGCERPRHARSDDGRLPPHRGDVGEHRQQRGDLAGPAGNAKPPGKQEGARDHVRDVLAGNRQEVVEAGGAEVVAELLVEPLVLSEHDTGDDSAPLTVQPGGEGASDASPQCVREPSDPAPVADDAVATRTEHDVDALSLQIGSLVEPFSRFCATGATNSGDHLEQRPLWRGAAEWKLEARGLVDLLVAKSEHPHRNAYGKRATPGRAGHLEEGGAGFTGGESELAPVDLVESNASPPKACEEHCGPQRHYSSFSQPDRAESQKRRGNRQSKTRGAEDER